jgi:bla regulator protein BlaR1
MTTPFLVNHLWQSSCFVLLAGLLAFALRKNSPKVRYWLWLSASLKFLIPFALLVSLGTVVPRPDRYPVSVAAPVFPNTLVQIAEPFSPTLKAIVPGHAPLDWVPVAIGLVWALGFLAITLARCRSWLGVRAALRAGTPIELPIPVRALITPGAGEPGIVGFLRPVLVLPAQLLEHLNPPQLGAILTHELCHVRRRDNLFAAVHMVVEAIFWFHPLVWWIGSRMVEERELACDEEVLRMGCEPADYVEGILKVCRFYLESPLPCISGVTGADVKRRLRAILAGSIAHELSATKKMTLATIGLAALAAPVLIGVLNAPAIRAQSGSQPTARLDSKFEVASIKAITYSSEDGVGIVFSGIRPSPDGITASRVNLAACIKWAFGLKEYQISGLGPSSSEVYDISAKAAGRVGLGELKLMLQNLLADRFKLVFHRGKKDLPTYVIVLGEHGLSANAADGEGSFTMSTELGHQTLKGKMSMPQLADALGRELDRPVIDMTGLKGVFEIKLSWLPDENGFNAGSTDTTPLGPSLSMALRELGLMLRTQKSPVEILVVDRVARPSEN